LHLEDGRLVREELPASRISERRAVGVSEAAASFSETVPAEF
jgi:hypothetical protein